MVLRINFNPIAVNSHKNLMQIDRSLADTISRLSSGLRVQKASDDPAALVLSNSLRYNGVATAEAINNVEEGINFINTAEGAMDEMSGILNRIRSLAVGAMSTATSDPTQVAAMQKDLDAAVSSLDRIAKDTRYGKIPLLDGTMGDNRIATASSDVLSALRSDASLMPAGITALSSLDIAVPATVTLTRSYSAQLLPPTTPPQTTLAALGYTVPQTLTINGPLASATVAIDASTSIEGLVAQVNSIGGITGVQGVYDQLTGELRLQNRSFGNLPLSITGVGLFGGVTTGNAPATVQLSYTDASGSPQGPVTLTQVTAQDGGLAFTNAAGNGGPAPVNSIYRASAFTAVFADTSQNAVSMTIAATAGTPYAATRQSTVDIQSGPLSDQQINLEIPSLRSSVLGRTAGLAGGVPDLASLNDLVSQQTLINGYGDQTLNVIDAAIREVLESRARAGATSGNALETTASSLRVSQQSLKESESQLRDADFATESAEYAKQNILLQAATAMLAQANQVPQTVLQLLK